LAFGRSLRYYYGTKPRHKIPTVIISASRQTGLPLGYRQAGP
jgi:predicted GTPase